MASMFIVWLEAQAHACLSSEPASFLINSQRAQERVTVQTRWRDELGQKVVDALQLETGLEAESLDEAVILAGTRANRWLAALAFAARAPVGDARALLAYDVGSDMEKRPFVQYFYEVPWPGALVAAVDGSHVQKVINGWGRFEDRRHWEVSRAFYWYRRGVREQDPGDKFTQLWLGLEALESFLRERFRIQKSSQRCHACNRLLEDPSSAGVRAYLESSAAGLLEYRRARRLRVNLLHTVAQDVSLEREARELAQQLEPALRGAIEMVIQESVPVTRFPPLSDLLFAVRGKFVGIDNPKVGGPHPHFRLEVVETKKKRSHHGMPRFDARLVPVGTFQYEIDGWLVPPGSRIVSDSRGVISEE